MSDSEEVSDSDVIGSLRFDFETIRNENDNLKLKLAETGAMLAQAGLTIETLQAERDHLLVKAESMHIVTSAIASMANIGFDKHLELLITAEIGIRRVISNPAGLAEVRETLGLNSLPQAR